MVCSLRFLNAGLQDCQLVPTVSLFIMRLAALASLFLLFTAVFSRDISKVDLNECGVSISMSQKGKRDGHGKADREFLRRHNATNQHVTPPQHFHVSAPTTASTRYLCVYKLDVEITQTTIVSCS